MKELYLNQTLATVGGLQVSNAKIENANNPTTLTLKFSTSVVNANILHAIQTLDSHALIGGLNSLIENGNGIEYVSIQPLKS